MRATSIAVAWGLVAAATGCTTPADPDAWLWHLPSGFPEPRVPDDNPMTRPKVELGRHLFYDPRLSGNRTQSCASCHVQARAFSDGNVVAAGSTGELGRHNVPSIVNSAWNSVQGWANPALIALEQQALVPLFGDAPVELGLAGAEDEMLARLRAEPRYAALFAAAFDDPDAFTVANVARALACFDRSIVSCGSPYDRYQAGDRAALTASQRRGLDLFNSERLECHHCHTGFALTITYVAANSPPGGYVHYSNDGLYNLDAAGAYPATDRGVVEITGLARDIGRFRPPSLRNVALTAPYMHDGSVATLGDVVDVYARGGRLIASGPYAGDGALNPHKSELVFGFTLTADERADLLAFFDSLTDGDLVSNPSYANPWPL